jgi:hypothetical protein
MCGSLATNFLDRVNLHRAFFSPGDQRWLSLDVGEGAMTTFLRIAYVVMGIVQFFAIWDGAIEGLGLNSFFGFIIALILAGIPLIGSATGMYGAVTAWDWGWLQAFLLFFWYIPLLIIVGGYGWWADRQESRS